MDIKYQAGTPLPTSVGRCADLFHEVRSLRLAMEKEVEAVKQREGEIREHIIAQLDASDDTGATGLRYRAQIKVKTRPTVSDWDALRAYIVEHERFDLLQRRIADKAVMDMLDDGVRLPGVEKIHVKEVSITKA